MSSISGTARDVFVTTAALLNDQAQSVYTDAVQMPYLNAALQELQETFEQNNIPVTNDTSAVIQVDAGVTEIGFNTVPALPSDLIDIQFIWQRVRNTNPWLPLTPRLDFLPEYNDDVETPYFLYWAWQNQKIKLQAASGDMDLKLDYIKSIFVTVTSSNDILDVVNCLSYLHYRTASLCAQFIGENKTRADDLNAFAVLALDRSLGIGTKGTQAILTRRRPFRQSFKNRSSSW